MQYNWEDLPEKKNCFTVRSAAMINLDNKKVIRNYSANTKIVLVQRCITANGTYYRTGEATHNNLNYAFEASAFGLPNEKAPSAPSSRPSSLSKHTTIISKSGARTNPKKKQKDVKKEVALPKGGEGRRTRSWLKRIFRRKNG